MPALRLLKKEVSVTLVSKMVDNALLDLAMINMVRHPKMNATWNASMTQIISAVLDGGTVSGQQDLTVRVLAIM